MEKLKVLIGPCHLYIDGDEEDATMANEVLEDLLNEKFNKPDWYYKAKAKHTLGTL